LTDWEASERREREQDSRDRERKHELEKREWEREREREREKKDQEGERVRGIRSKLQEDARRVSFLSCLSLVARRRGEEEETRR